MPKTGMGVCGRNGVLWQLAFIINFRQPKNYPGTFSIKHCVD